jgi:PAS domain S-box-containing protein
MHTSRDTRAAEIRERALLEAIPDYVFRISRDGTYLDFHAHELNEALEDRDAFIGSTIWDQLPGNVADELHVVIERVLESGETATYENQLEHAGETRAFESRVVKNGEDECVSIVRDISDRKAAEEELRQSRARIVEAADAARRHLERDLHDGAQQRLVGVMLTLKLALARIESDPAEARSLLEGGAGELADALAELRELARGIHPAVLSDQGLAAALPALASRAALPVEVTSVPDGRLPEALEIAVYYLVSEALTNVAKYAHASAASISVSRLGPAVSVVVTDDGIGGADPAAGSGLQGLEDRIAALGGSLVVESPRGGGTTIRAEVPL